MKEENSELMMEARKEELRSRLSEINIRLTQIEKEDNNLRFPNDASKQEKLHKGEVFTDFITKEAAELLAERDNLLYELSVLADRTADILVKEHDWDLWLGHYPYNEAYAKERLAESGRLEKIEEVKNAA